MKLSFHVNTVILGKDQRPKYHQTDGRRLNPCFKKTCVRQTSLLPPHQAAGSVNRSLLLEAAPQNACSCRKHRTRNVGNQRGAAAAEAEGESREPFCTRGLSSAAPSVRLPEEAAVPRSSCALGRARGPGAEAAGRTLPEPSSGAAAAPGFRGRFCGRRPLPTPRRPEQRPAPRAAGGVAAALPLQVREGGRAALAAAGRGAQQGGPRAGLCGQAGERLPRVLAPPRPRPRPRLRRSAWAAQRPVPGLLRHPGAPRWPRSADRLRAGSQPSPPELTFRTNLQGARSGCGSARGLRGGARAVLPEALVALLHQLHLVPAPQDQRVGAPLLVQPRDGVLPGDLGRGRQGAWHTWHAAAGARRPASREGREPCHSQSFRWDYGLTLGRSPRPGRRSVSRGDH